MVRQKVRCPKCGGEMNHHADKLVHASEEPGARIDPALGGVVYETHACPACGNVVMTPQYWHR